jgi:hypothetical protein
MPQSRKQKSKKVNNTRKNRNKKSHSQSGGLLKVSNEQSGGLLKVSNEQSGGQVQGLSTYMELSIYDKKDPTQNITLEWNDLKSFYKENGLIEEPNLFIVSFRETTDMAIDTIATVINNFTKKDDKPDDEENQENPDKPIPNKDAIINMFPSSVKSTPNPNNIIHYEIINKEKTIKFLLIVLKFKLLYLNQSDKIKEVINIFKSGKKLEIEIFLKEKKEKDPPDNIFHNKIENINLLNELFVKLSESIKPVESAESAEPEKPKPNFDSIIAKNINQTAEWNESELAVLEYFSKDSNTIYGILAKFLGIEDITTESEFVKPRDNFFDLFKDSDESDEAANTKMDFIMSRGKKDSEMVITELMKNIQDPNKKNFSFPNLFGKK